MDIIACELDKTISIEPQQIYVCCFLFVGCFYLLYDLYLQIEFFVDYEPRDALMKATTLTEIFNFLVFFVPRLVLIILSVCFLYYISVKPDGDLTDKIALCFSIVWLIVSFSVFLFKQNKWDTYVINSPHKQVRYWMKYNDDIYQVIKKEYTNKKREYHDSMRPLIFWFRVITAFFIIIYIILSFVNS